MHIARDDHLLRHDRDLAGLDADRGRRSRSSCASARSAACIRTWRSRSSTTTAARCRAARRGELCTRGYSVMRGYWNNDDATRAAIDAAGWMHSGDLATMDERGYVNIVGRMKDMIIRGGENIYPREVEEFLHTHPAVSEAQVIGVPSEKYGEEVMAWVRLKPGAQLERRRPRSALQGAHRHLQDPALLEARRRLPDDRHRQGAEVPHARARHRRARSWARRRHQDRVSDKPKASSAALALAALGVVFGDIGTSPLYALKECVSQEHGVAPSAANVLGVALAHLLGADHGRLDQVRHVHHARRQRRRRRHPRAARARAASACAKAAAGA